jgi:hypothetical protein
VRCSVTDVDARLMSLGVQTGGGCGRDHGRVRAAERAIGVLPDGTAAALSVKLLLVPLQRKSACLHVLVVDPNRSRAGLGAGRPEKQVTYRNPLEHRIQQVPNLAVGSHERSL